MRTVLIIVSNVKKLKQKVKFLHNWGNACMICAHRDKVLSSSVTAHHMVTVRRKYVSNDFKISHQSIWILQHSLHLQHSCDQMSNSFHGPGDQSSSVYNNAGVRHSYRLSKWCDCMHRNQYLDISFHHHYWDKRVYILVMQWVKAGLQIILMDQSQVVELHCWHRVHYYHSPDRDGRSG